MTDQKDPRAVAQAAEIAAAEGDYHKLRDAAQLLNSLAQQGIQGDLDDD